MTIRVDGFDDLLDGIEEFDVKLESIDEEEVKRRAVKETAEELSELVRTSVSASPEIDSPSQLNSIYYQGAPTTDEAGRYQSTGPSLVHGSAWQVEKEGPSTYKVSPHPSVRKRAGILHHGRGPISSDNPMRFYVNGFPVFTQYVDGVDESDYWRSAVKKIQSEDALSENLLQEFRKEVEKAGL